MADDASIALGTPQLAGTLVNPRGLRAAGPALPGRATLGDYRAGAPEVPDFGRVGYLAASEHDLALVGTRTDALGTSLTHEVLARAPRSAVRGVDLADGRVVSRLAILFANGVIWEFDVPTMARPTARGLVGVLAHG
jgi:hypothetical protein